MAQTIKLKRSATQSAAPTVSQLALGELAINTYDGKLYLKKDVSGTESIVEIGAGGGGSSLPLSGGAMTGAITTNSTFDGRDVAADGATADAALPKSGGTMTGNIATDGISSVTAGTSNFVAGVNAGNSIVSGGNYNTVVGDEAGTAITTGDSNTAVGKDALLVNTTASNNTAVGKSALRINSTGTSNVAIGKDTLVSNSTGSANVAVGQDALVSNTTASNNTAVGYSSLGANTTGASNVAVGKDALLANTTGSQNAALGNQALGRNTTGERNHAFGTSINGATDGALGKNTTGNDNVAFGHQALSQNTTASNNTAVGKSALYANTTGAGNVAVGSSALDANTTANNNTAVGYASLTASTTGTENVAVGRNALLSSTTASYNTALGTNSLQTNTTGGNNCAFGTGSLKANTTASNNTAMGYRALLANTTGTKNIAIGYGAGDAITTGSNNTIIGDIAGTSTLADTVIIGAGTTERLRIDSSGNVGIGTSSPAEPLHVQEGGGSGATAAAGTIAFIDGNANTKVTIASGTTSTGRINFGRSTDNNAGSIIYDHNDNSLAAKVSGSEAMRIDSSGNVGIGTTTPSTALEVSGTVTTNDVNITDTTPNLKFTDTDGNHLANITQSGSHLYIDNDSTGNIRMRVDGNTERLTINHTGATVTGNIAVTGTVDGIDIATRDAILTSTTTTAAAALPKAGGAMTGEITTNSTFDGRDVATDGTKLDGIETSATADQTAAQLLTALKTVDVNGTSGLNAGTLDGHALTSASTASTVVERNTSGDINARLFRSEYDSTNSTIGYVMTQVNTGADNYIRPSTPTQLRAGLGIEAGATADQTAAEIRTAVEAATNSNVFTDADHTKLNSVAASANNYTLPFTNNSTNWNTAYTVANAAVPSSFFAKGAVMEVGRYFDMHGANSATDFTVRMDCGAGSTATNGAGTLTITASGGLVCTGDITAFSDIRLKANIQPITKALDKVDQLRGVTFLRSDEDDEVRHTGLIAQDLQAVLPEAVRVGTDENETLSVAYGNTVGLLVEAIKELRAEVEALKNGTPG